MNDSVKKGKIKSEHLNFKRRLFATPKMKQLEWKHRYIFILYGDEVFDFYIISFIIVNENFRGADIKNTLLNI